MVGDTVAFLVGEGRRVFLDCEHFFDGYAADHDYGIRVAEAATLAGADVIVMCDTNGGMMPVGLHQVVTEVKQRTGFRLGHPLPGRHRLRRGQHRGRGAGRRHPRPVHRQRLRRTGRQCGPVRGAGQPGGQAGDARAARRQTDRAGPGVPRAGRVGQHRARTPTRPTSVRRRSRTRPACTPRRSRSTPSCTTT